MEGLILFGVSLISLGAIYAILCLALNLDSGVGGLWDLGIVSFFGIGAYAYTLVTAPPAAAHQNYVLGLGLPMILGLVAAIVFGGLAAWLIGLPSLRLKREFFLITTIAFAEVIRQIYSNEAWLTNGVAGIYGLQQPFRQMVSPDQHAFVMMGIFLAGAAAAYVIVQKLTLSPFGRTLKALRENEALAMTAGIKPRSFNMRVFVTTGCLCGFAGAFYVWYNTLLTPPQFTSDITFFIWTALIIGGLGNNRGALLGGFVFILLHDMLRFVQVSGDLVLTVSSLRLAIVGLVLIAILRLRPEGLFPERPAILPSSSAEAAR